jgi:hypothetical protein
MAGEALTTASAAAAGRYVYWGEGSKVLRGFVNSIGLRMISSPDYSSTANQHAPIFDAKAVY